MLRNFQYEKMRLIIIIIFILLSNASYAKIQLPRLISDGMVLQRESDITVWGWAKPGENVNICFLDKSHHTTADKNGNWKMLIKTGEAGGPYEMTITGMKDALKIKDILLGDVYICSGQSNMAFKLDRIEEKYSEDIKNSTNDHIRQFLVKPTWSHERKTDVESDGWIKAEPKSVLDFSAVAYFFAQQLYHKYRIPIGIINASYSATVAEGWISKEGLQGFPSFVELSEKYNNIEKITKIIENQKNINSNWFDTLEQKEVSGGGYNNINDVNFIAWDYVTVPGFWSSQKLKNFTGSVWLKKVVKIGADLLKKPCKLYLGGIDDRYEAYINGNEVGREWRRGADKIFPIPSHVLQQGKNIITLRIVNPEGPGGFYLERPNKLTFEDKIIDLAGEWQYKIGIKMPILSSKEVVKFNLIPTFLFNGMIHPLGNYCVKGVVWYQGEGNVSRGKQYQELFQALINDWRRHWSNADLPFLFVQLPNFGNPNLYNTSWAVLRESQAMALQLPNVGMAVTYDIGETHNIHPNNKKEVGERLSLVARKMIYADNVQASGPVFKQMSVQSNKIFLEFDNLPSVDHLKNTFKTIEGFYIADKSRKFYPATISIQDNMLVVTNKDIDKPVAVRYAWLNNPLNANFYNKEGLPAIPFRTDNWDDAVYMQ